MPKSAAIQNRAILKRIVILAAVAAVLASGCTNETVVPERPTHLRLLVSTNDGLQLVNLDVGSSRILVEPSETNGDYWSFERVTGGVVAQGRAGGSGAGPVELTAWFVGTEATPKARLLGTATDVLADPAGGVWLVDMPHSDGGIGAGSVSLVDLAGRVLRKGTVACCQRPVASLGNGRFVTETENDDGIGTIRVFDAFSKRITMQVSPPRVDARFQRMEAGRIMWAESGCTDVCTLHLFDVATGEMTERRGRNEIVSLGSSHVATEIGIEAGRTIQVDGKSIARSSDAGFEWSPDGRLLVFVRPDRMHFAVWDVATRSARTIPVRFGELSTWSILDRSFSRS